MQSNTAIVRPWFVVIITAWIAMIVGFSVFYNFGVTLAVVTTLLTIVVVPAACYGVAVTVSATGKYVHARPQLERRLNQMGVAAFVSWFVLALLISDASVAVSFRTILVSVVALAIETVVDLVSFATTIRGLLVIIAMILFIIARHLIKLTSSK